MRPGLWIAIGALLVMVIVYAIGVRTGKRPAGGDLVVRCRAGHLFTTLWVPLGSIKAVRLGAYRLQRCPVGHHWSLVSPVDPESLSPTDLAEARSHHDAWVP